MFGLITNKFGVLAEETTDETTHIEQHRTQSYTIGDATDIAVQRHHTERQNPKSTTKDTRSTNETDDEREQQNKDKETAMVETAELLKKQQNISTKRPTCPQEIEFKTDPRVELRHEVHKKKSNICA